MNKENLIVVSLGLLCLITIGLILSDARTGNSPPVKTLSEKEKCFRDGGLWAEGKIGRARATFCIYTPLNPKTKM